jgi:hypothetical protein
MRDLRPSTVATLALLSLVACGDSTVASAPDAAQPRDGAVDATGGTDARLIAEAATGRDAEAVDTGLPDCGAPPPGVCPGGQLVCTAAGWTCSGSSACSGPAPDCFGMDSTLCCGQDPAGPAVCVGAVWMCGSASAPGCNGVSCVGLPDAGLDGASDATSVDAGPTTDAGSADAGGTACGALLPDGGGTASGPCASGGQCCPGGAAGSHYCYTGDGGCPALP